MRRIIVTDEEFDELIVVERTLHQQHSWSMEWDYIVKKDDKFYSTIVELPTTEEGGGNYDLEERILVEVVPVEVPTVKWVVA